jgi:tetratricopeptide (TPR) repeat protein
MSFNAAKLKKKAAELEQKKQFDKALQLYIQILDESPGDDEADVALYNRVGDLLMREGRVGDAMTYYEKAVDLYAESGFFNNAIALCNKILRQSPGRSSIYYKLGKISAKKGFISDAKQNFLEYADRMQKAEQLDEAFRALKEFADLCPDQDDIRLMLADQLSKKGRTAEAIDQLQQLYDKFEAEGRGADMSATVDRMKAIDAKAEPKTGRGPRQQKSSDLVFLDLGDGGPPPPRRSMPGHGSRTAPASNAPGIAATLTPAYAPALTPTLVPVFEVPTSATPDSVSTPDATIDTPSSTSAEPEREQEPESPRSPKSEVELGHEDAGRPAESPTLGNAATERDATVEERPVAGLMIREHFDADVAATTQALRGFEPSALDTDTPARPLPDLLADLEPPLSGVEFAALSLPTPLSVEAIEPRAHDLALPGALPSLEDALEPLVPSPRPPSLTGDMELMIPESEGPAKPASAPADRHLVDVPASRKIDDKSDALNLVGGAEALAVQERAAPDPADWGARRQLAETLLEDGKRDAGLREMEAVMVGLERGQDLDGARSVAEELIRVDPNSVRHHQKRVEYAFRTADTSRLPAAYLELADALFRAGQPEKARAVYQRVLELAPTDPRALAALSAFGGPADFPSAERAGSAEPAPSKGPARRYTDQARRPARESDQAIPRPREETTRPRPTADSDYVNLGDWLRQEEEPKSTRMIVDEQEPSGDEAADFADMLKRFKQGVAQNVEPEDSDSHFDLGVAYKEMGLLDEAIAEFQKALLGAGRRVRTYEALGQCFLEKKQVQVASTILGRALTEPGAGDEQLVGVLYLLGYAAEAMHQSTAAVQYYQRVFAIDVEFRDVAKRLAGLERQAT